jgi:riboflavin kinase/FMN adenylyltransferase
MKVIYSYNSEDCINKPTGVGLGNFDGLHIGHMALINTLINESRINGLDSVLYTFMKHPENILRKKLFTPLLTTVTKKIQLLNSTALDYVFFDEFDEEYSRIKPESFVKDILLDKLKAKLVVAGFNYKFGYNGQGDAKLLKEMGKKYNFKVIIISPIQIENMTVSSTIIRENVAKGDMEMVFKLLGRHYSITGDVRNGHRRGAKLGFPTANIHPEAYLTLPHKGVYVTKTLLDGKFYEGITNVGLNPTFSENANITVETHLLDFDKDIYDENIEVFFLSKLRSEKKFKNKDELTAQVSKDIKSAREYFGANA